jgi:DNA polymerase I
MYAGLRAFAACAVFPSGKTVYCRGDLSSIKKIVEDASLEKIFFNANYDVGVLENMGMTVRGKIHDARIMCHLVDPRTRPKSLDVYSTKFLRERKSVDELQQWFKEHKIRKAEQGTSYAKVAPDLLKRYCIQDTTLTLKLFYKLLPIVQHEYSWLYDRESRVLSCVKKMRDRGVIIDWQEWEAQHEYLSGIIEETQLDLEGFIGRELNPASRNDVEELLGQHGLLKRITEKTKTGALSFSEDSLRELNHLVAFTLIRHRKAKTLRDRFLNNIRDNAVGDTLHAQFDLCGTLSGRFSCSAPNLMNIPREGDQLTPEEIEAMYDEPVGAHIKRLFRARPGYVNAHSDKKQVEVRFLVHYAQDAVAEEMITKGEGLHFEICKRMFGKADPKLKQRAKQIVFGWQYGMSMNTLSKRLSCTRADAQEYFRLFETVFPKARSIRQRWEDQVHERGFIITDHGRKHYLSNRECYMSINRMCQGTAADELKDNMVMCHEFFEAEAPECSVLLNIHDDLGSEIPAERLRELLPKYHEMMCSSKLPWYLPMPSETEITPINGRWADKKEATFPDGKMVLPEGYVLP